MQVAQNPDSKVRSVPAIRKGMAGLHHVTTRSVVTLAGMKLGKGMWVGALSAQQQCAKGFAATAA